MGNNEKIIRFMDELIDQAISEIPNSIILFKEAIDHLDNLEKDSHIEINDKHTIAAILANNALLLAKAKIEQIKNID